MKLGLSSSSPFAVAALLDDDFTLIEQLSARAERNASELLIEMIDSLLKSRGTDIGGVSGIVVDRGPGGFTGVKVAVTLAKSISWSRGLELYASTSFDLIDPDGVVSVPFKSGTFIVRRPNEDPAVSNLFEGKGYGGSVPETYPSFADLGHLEAVAPIDLVPLYVVPPSISTPKHGLGGKGP